MLVNVHLFFGGDSDEEVERRALEAYAVARWADLRRKSKNAYSKNIICLGDFNLPSFNEAEPVHVALRKRGIYLAKYGTTVPVHAGVLLERSGRQPLPRVLFQRLPGRLAPR